MGRSQDISTIPKRIFRDQLVAVADLEQFKEDILLSLARLINEHSAPPPKKWLKSYEVKKLLALSNGTLQTLRSNGTLPFTKIGNTAYYEIGDIEKIMQERKRPCIKELFPKKKTGQ
jgi:hypothetical protein